MTLNKLESLVFAEKRYSRTPLLVSPKFTLLVLLPRADPRVSEVFDFLSALSVDASEAAAAIGNTNDHNADQSSSLLGEGFHDLYIDITYDVY